MPILVTISLGHAHMHTTPCTLRLWAWTQACFKGLKKYIMEMWVVKPQSMHGAIHVMSPTPLFLQHAHSYSTVHKIPYLGMNVTKKATKTWHTKTQDTKQWHVPFTKGTICLGAVNFTWQGKTWCALFICRGVMWNAYGLVWLWQLFMCSSNHNEWTHIG